VEKRLNMLHFVETINFVC